MKLPQHNFLYLRDFSLQRLQRLKKKRGRRVKQQSQILMAVARIQRIFLSAALMSLLLLTNNNVTTSPIRRRSCRRYSRNAARWDLVWSEYCDLRLNETFRMSRGTFIYILKAIRPEFGKRMYY